MPAQTIKDALPNVPAAPGVYLMKDAGGVIIYVGKAKSLRSRLGSYAREEQYPGWYRHKVQTMVAQVEAVEYIVTATEKEALILENTLIKRHRPRFNVDLRDDKSHLLLRLDYGHPYPRISLVRKAADDGARYFGPFDKAGAVRKTLRMLQRVFPLRRCSDHVFNNRSRPCLDFDMGRCPAPCTGEIGEEEYRAMADEMCRFFAGEGQKVAASLERRMKRAAAAEEFERAARLRDRWQALSRTLERQAVASPGAEDVDALALHDDGRCYRLAVIGMRAGRVVASRVFELSEAALSPEEVMGQALTLLYDQAAPPPPLLLVSHMPPEPGLLAEVLAERAGRKVELRRPQRGEKRSLMELAVINASQPRAAAPDDSAKALERIGRKLNLPGPPQSMECMDISHLGGRLTVASVVAFSGGEPDKGCYRRYKIIGAEGAPDDYAAMAEVVRRRLGGDRPPPDLLVLDGGKGQLNAAAAVLEDLAPERRPPIAALAKGRGQGPDKVYLPGRKNPVNLPARDPALLLLMRLRDEAHRFAVSYHRLLRKKALTRSILEEVPGVGPKKAARLLKALGSLAALKRADAGEMHGRSGVDLAACRAVQAFLSALDSPQPQE